MRQTDKYCFFWSGSFSQWHLTKMFDLNRIAYNCCEQFMMYQKAILFQDKEKAKAILHAKSPKEQKNLGREVRNFNPDIWDKFKNQIVWSANYFKFSQNRDLRNQLFSTGDRLLVEASPYDKIWGVGLREDNNLILDPKNWQGENLLGKALTSVRNFLRQG